MLDAGWKQWYRNEHETKFNELQGDAFEEYVSAVLKAVDPDFVNPDAIGNRGDKGCDGISGDGKTLYACYGKSPKTLKHGREDYLVHKMEDDLNKCLKNWPTVQAWRFVTNAPFGDKATKKYLELRNQHKPDSASPLSIKRWGCQELWEEFAKVPEEKMKTLLDPAPHAQDARFEDIVEAIESIGSGSINIPQTLRIGEVSPTKMEHNHIDGADIYAFNQGRQRAPDIKKWFDAQPDATLYDKKAQLLRERYEEAKKSSTDPREIVEQLYIYIGGPDFRLNQSRSMAVYAVVAYFFDQCDIFEDPYDETHDEEGDYDAATDQRS